MHGPSAPSLLCVAASQAGFLFWGPRILMALNRVRCKKCVI